MRLSDAIKELALGAVESESPVDVMPAEVLSASPLSIRIRDNDKLVIPSDLLVVAEHLTDHTREIEMDGEKKTIRFYNQLNTGDYVMIAAMPGGQSFFVIDKI
ncbi:DUF2577 domain-containing protein [Bacillus swezeyi]|uniref:DUF2577 domain-containing protein n=1 Tax=Bacillus swezeyi TaxID=1925020 RepID=A0A5M8RS19_9BACI|nr:DUF2577 domain-containing protein [Bacillus swezeyi]KAA6450338.1 DUF2577 domain-containing protein [Bacillus swezeyi]TYS36880.1 DUF2577 domain-containing protein [Bacillus swezeyi]